MDSRQTARIQTFVIFDLEATGLPSNCEDYPVRITEISMSAVQRAETAAGGPRPELTALPPEQRGMTTPKRRQPPADECRAPERSRRRLVEPVTPPSPAPAALYSPLPPPGRVRNCLLLAVNPRKQIPPRVSDLTGLDNELLEGHGGFDASLAELLGAFLARLPEPVCLVAHNGNRYDFPLLVAELRHAGSPWLDDAGIVCADTVLFFREEWMEREQADAVYSLDDSTLCCSHDDMRDECIVCNPSLFVSFEEVTTNCEFEVTRVGDRRAIRCFHVSRSSCVVCEHVPLFRCQPAARRQLFDGERAQRAAKPSAPSMKLPDVFERRFGLPPEVGHTASADVEALSQLCLSHGERFFCWADRHSRRLADIKAMWRRRGGGAQRSA